MNVRLTATLFAAVFICTLMSANGSQAQEPLGPESKARRLMFSEAAKSPQSSPSTDPAKLKADRVAQLRQARAMYRSQQRIARLEHNLWIGYEPLRPNWNAVPMMSSRYNSRRTIYVPVYVPIR